jgi:hypothetical protein
MNRCPVCGSTFVRPTRPTAWQRLWFRATAKRPHACWHCGWTGWLPLDAGDETPPTDSSPRPRDESPAAPRQEMAGQPPRVAGSDMLGAADI